MRAQNETRGVLCLGERMGTRGYSDAEVNYLSGLANITITALENTRLIREMIDKQRLEQELNVARTIQKGLLPAVIPAVKGYGIAAINDSSQQIGGDYYDVVPLSEHEYILAIGDVAGKGIPASLLMANVQAALRTIAPLRLSLPEATSRINSLIHNNTGMDKFITFFWGILDVDKHTFTYVNAGHNPPYLLHTDGTHEPLSTGGLILGVLEHTPDYESATVHLREGGRRRHLRIHRRRE
jgi:sigma-B regulation protein RsbU (phosphoserine phosphatase)